MEFFCSICNNGHDYKTTQGLNKHKNAASHKRKVDAEFAAAEEAKKEAGKAAKKAEVSTDEFFCSVCGNGHDYKTLQKLKYHEKTASHKRKLDPKLAAAQQLPKKLQRRQRRQQIKRLQRRKR